MKRKRRCEKWLTHYIAWCEDCDWRTEDFLQGRRQASQHAAKTGHRVRAEEGYVVRYNERKEADNG